MRIQPSPKSFHEINRKERKKEQRGKKEKKKKRAKESSLSNDGGSEGLFKGSKSMTGHIIGPLPPSRMRVNNTVSVPSAALKKEMQLFHRKSKRPGISEIIVNTVQRQHNILLQSPSRLIAKFPTKKM